jgi:hypothetical protein
MKSILIWLLDLLPVVFASAISIGGLLFPPRLARRIESNKNLFRAFRFALVFFGALAAFSSFRQQNKAATKDDIRASTKTLRDSATGGNSLSYIAVDEDWDHGDHVNLFVRIDGENAVNISFIQCSLDDADNKVVIAYPDGQPGLIRPNQSALLRGQVFLLEEISRTFNLADEVNMTCKFRASNGNPVEKISFSRPHSKYAMRWKWASAWQVVDPESHRSKEVVEDQYAGSFLPELPLARK